jgi:hypothetical protein
MISAAYAKLNVRVVGSDPGVTAARIAERARRAIARKKGKQECTPTQRR